MISRAEKFMELGLGQGWTGKREGLRLGGDWAKWDISLQAGRMAGVCKCLKVRGNL